jgi:hypothetical protein
MTHLQTHIGTDQDALCRFLLGWGVPFGLPVQAVHLGCDMVEDGEPEVQRGHSSDDASRRART